MRPYGRTGLQVSMLGFGAMQIGDPALGVTRVARARGCGTIAKRSLAGRAWAGGMPADEAQAGYRARAHEWGGLV
jgi:aryl-alcohol dehydrogenase-like predicted oxidoreductase